MPKIVDHDAIRAEFARTGCKATTARNLGVDRSTVIRHTKPGPEPSRGFLHHFAESLASRLASRTPEPPRPHVEDADSDGITDLAEIPERILVVGDLHCQYHHDAAVEAMLSYASDCKPDWMVLNGDLYDCRSISHHEKSVNWRESLREDLDTSRPVVEKIASLGLRTKYILGNHEDWFVQAFEKVRGMEGLLRFEEVAELPKDWEVYPNQSMLRIGGVHGLTVLHGDMEGVRGGGKYVARTLAERVGGNCLFNHFHRFQAIPVRGYGGGLRSWDGYANGHMLNAKKACGRYIAHPDWQVGFSEVEFDPDAPGVFSVRQHRWRQKAFRIGGKTYRG